MRKTLNFARAKVYFYDMPSGLSRLIFFVFFFLYYASACLSFFPPGSCKLDGAFQGSNQEALDMSFYLLRHEGLYVGPSAGLNVAGAVKLARKLGKWRASFASFFLHSPVENAGIQPQPQQPKKKT